MQCSRRRCLEELTGGMRVRFSSKNGGYYGLWTSRFAVADWRAAADHYFVGPVLAPLTGNKQR